MASTKKERTRELLLGAAWKRLERGDPAKLEEVGADVGVSRQAVYLHFGSRGGMLLALVEFIDEQLGLAAHLKEVFAHEDPVEQLEALLGFATEYEPKIHGVAMAAVRLSDTDAEVRAALEDRMKHRRRGMRLVVERLDHAGRLQKNWKIDEIVDALWEASAPSSYEHLVVERGWKPERYRDWLVWLARSFLKKR